MNQPRWYHAGDPALEVTIRRVWDSGITRPRFPPGVYKHRTIEDMNALTEQWAAANFVAHRERFETELAELLGRADEAEAQRPAADEARAGEGRLAK